MGGAPEYREWAPPAPLARHVACSWAGRLGDDGVPYTERVLPDGCVDLVWDGRHLFVAGPDTGPVPVAHRPRGFFVGLRFRPGAAPAALAVPACDLRDQRIDATAVLGRRAGALAGALAGAGGLRDAALVLERQALRWLRNADPPDPLVEAAVASLRAWAPPRPVSSLADELGIGTRRLHRRCTTAVGYGPKTLDRVLRFRRFLDLAEHRRDLGLGVLAAAAGYTDQPHLTRECQRLAGVTPATLVPAVDGRSSSGLPRAGGRAHTPGQLAGFAAAQSATARAGDRSWPARHASRYGQG